jgi:hypothetical protein
MILFYTREEKAMAMAGQGQQQIPFGDDNKKGKCNCKKQNAGFLR